MVDYRLGWAQRLALAGLVIVIIYHIDEVLKASGSYGYLSISDSLMRGALFGIPALFLSAASFVLAWNRPSILVSIILLVSGGLVTADGIMIGTKYLSILTIPGPVIGLFYGLAMLSFGIIKATMTTIGLKQPSQPKSSPKIKEDRR